MSNYRDALRFLTKVKRLQPLQHEFEQKVIEKASRVHSEIEELRKECEKPFPKSEANKCTILERQIIEKMGEYSKVCQKAGLARIDYYLGLVPENEFIDLDVRASNLLNEAVKMSSMLLKERFVIVL